MSYPIFVISLATVTERRKFMEQQLNNKKIPFEFFNAIDGRISEHPLFKKYNKEKRLKQKGNELAGGELGCFASHYLLWEKCIALNTPIIIIEDDAVIFDNFMAFYKDIKNFSKNSLYLRLFVNDNNKPYKVIDRKSGYDIVRYLKGPRATRGYLIKPSAAKAFIMHAQEWVWPVDDYMDMSWIHKVQCQGIIPGVIQGEGAGFISTIADAKVHKNKKTLTTKLIREIYNVRNKTMELLYNIKLYKKERKNK